MFRSSVRAPTAPRLSAPHSLEDAMIWYDAQQKKKLPAGREDSELVNGSALSAQHIENPEEDNAAQHIENPEEADAAQHMAMSSKANGSDIAKMRGAFAKSVEELNDTTSYTPPHTIATTDAIAKHVGGIDRFFSEGTTADSMAALVRSEKERAAFEDKKLRVVQAKPRYHKTLCKNKDCPYTCEKIFSMTPPNLFSVKAFVPHCAECVRPDKPTSVYTASELALSLVSKLAQNPSFAPAHAVATLQEFIAAPCGKGKLLTWARSLIQATTDHAKKLVYGDVQVSTLAQAYCRMYFVYSQIFPCACRKK